MGYNRLMDNERIERTADGDPLEDLGIARTAEEREKRSDDLQGDDDFEETNAPA